MTAEELFKFEREKGYRTSDRQTIVYIVQIYDSKEEVIVYEGDVESSLDYARIDYKKTLDDVKAKNKYVGNSIRIVALDCRDRSGSRLITNTYGITLHILDEKII